MKTPLLIVISLMAGNVFSVAQEKPPAPRLPVPPARASWTIDYKYAKDNRKAGTDPEAEVEPGFPPRPKKQEYIVTGDTALLRETYADGTKTEIYQAGSLELRRPNRSARILVLDLTVQPLPGQLFRKIYPGVDWVNPGIS